MVLNDWNSWNLQCGAVTAGGRGRCRVKWSEGQNTLAWGQSARQLTCPHVGRWDFDAGRLISAKDYFGGILIPSPVCRQHDLIWTSESKISRNLPQVKTILSSVFFSPLLLWIWFVDHASWYFGKYQVTKVNIVFNEETEATERWNFTNKRQF